MKKQVLVIIGMHRSGTSASTGALRYLGVDLGDRLYQGHAGINDKGYFEHAGIADTNDEVLATLGSSWDDVLLRSNDWWKQEKLALYVHKVHRLIRQDFSRSPLWAVKDPRVCRLLPWWLEIFATLQITPHFLFVVRSPAAVHRSLEKRDGFPREKSFLLWALHYLEAERYSRGYARTFVDFDRFLEEPVESLLRVERELNLTFPVSVDEAKAGLSNFLSPDLRHHTAEQELQDTQPVLKLAQDLHGELVSATKELPLNISVLNELWTRMETIQQGFPEALVSHIRSSGVIRGGLQITFNRILRSWSWVIGKPVRWVERRFFGQDV
jgi:hypothetical protein